MSKRTAKAVEKWKNTLLPIHKIEAGEKIHVETYHENSRKVANTYKTYSTLGRKVGGNAKQWSLRYIN